MKPTDQRYVTANIPAFLIRSLSRALADLGLNTSRLTVGLGIALADLADPTCRVSFRQGREIILRALRLARERDPDIALGLETGWREKIGAVGMPGYAMLTAATVGEAVRVGLALQKETGSMLEFDMRAGPGEVVITAASRFPDPEIYVFLVEEAFANFMQIGTELVGSEFRPLRVGFTFPAPPNAEVYRKLFGCEIRFGQIENTFVIDPALDRQPLDSADPYCHAQILDFLAYSRQREVEASEIIETIERMLRQRLAEANSIASVARALGMSERTLRRRLAESGAAFQTLLNKQRANRALELLANPQMSIEQIAHAVGYTDVHNFRRAFRRWTGTTPGVARAEMSGNWPK